MINGAHVILYSKRSDADRAFFKDVLELGSVDVGGGWLIFGLPPAEVAVHPGEDNDTHELYLMCDDVEAFVAQMGERGIACTAISDQGWGRLTTLTLPGGGKLGAYEPRHARPAGAAKKTKARAGKATAKKAPKRAPAKRAAPKKKAPARKAAAKRKR
jgi:hypothetical protein